jgi:predicted Zn-dependent protease
VTLGRGSELGEVAERALAHARGEAQVTVTRERSQLARFAASRPTQATEIDEVTVEVTAVREGHTARAATTETGDDGLREVAARAGAAAEAAARTGSGEYPGLPPPGPEPRPHDGWDDATAGLDPDRAGTALEAIFGVARERGVEAAGTWTAGAVQTVTAATTGLRATDAVTDAYTRVLCRAPAGRTGFASQAASSAEALDPAAAARTAATKALTSGEAAQLEPGEYPAVLDADAVATLLEFLGALAFNGLAHAEGRGALAGRLGAAVASPAINFSDSPRYRGTLPRAVDAEGVAKSPLPLIQDGVAHAVVHDTRSSAVAGGAARSTGHAIEPGGAPAGPVPTNMVLVGGGADGVAELAATVERGIYVTRLWYVNPVHAKRTLLTGMTRDGTFLIEDGRITRPLRDVRFTDSVLGLLAHTEALDARPRLCCEGEFYGRRFAHGVVCPAIRVAALRVTGSTD